MKPDTTKTAEPMQNYAKENEAMQKLEAMVEELKQGYKNLDMNSPDYRENIDRFNMDCLIDIPIILPIIQDWKRMREALENLHRTTENCWCHNDYICCHCQCYNHLQQSNQFLDSLFPPNSDET